MKMMGTSAFPGCIGKRIVVFFALLALLSGLSLGMFSAPLVSASEQAEEPQWSEDEGAYLISSLAELNWIRNDLGNNYVLDADIDASPTSGWNGGMGWRPIGNVDTPFTGSLDGKGHVITGLHINRPSENQVGLFGKAENADFVSVGLEDVSVTGRLQVGALAGWLVAGSVKGSYVDTGSVSGTAAGGLVGWLMDGSTVVDSHASVDVSSGGLPSGVAGWMKTAGGLVGWMDGSSIEGSYADSSVSAVGSTCTGGLAGKMTGASVVKSSHASGDITNERFPCGGLVGWMLDGTPVVEDSYATATVKSNGGSAGGLVGKVDYGAVVRKSYADSIVTNVADVPCGGLVGWLNGSVEDSYAMGSASASGPGPTGGIAGKMDAGSSMKSSYAITDVSSAFGPACDLVGWANGGTITDSMAENRMAENEELIGNENAATLVGRVALAPISDMQRIELYTVTLAGYPDLSKPWNMVAVESGVKDESRMWNIVDGSSYPFLPGPSKFELSDLSISKAEVEPGESFTVSVLVTNTGGERDSYTVELSIDGQTRTKDVTLDPEASETVSFDVSIEEEGTYAVSVGTMTGGVEVSAPEQPEDGGFPVVLVVAGVVAIVVVVIGILAYKGRKKSE